MIPGEIIISDKELEINAGSEAIEVEVSNTGDRPIQVGSHYHFFEVNQKDIFFEIIFLLTIMASQGRKI